MSTIAGWSVERRHELYRRCFAHWGIQAQEDMLSEEAAELIVAQNKWRRNPTSDTQEHLAEEICDVLFMIEEIILYHTENFEPGVGEMPFNEQVLWWFAEKLGRTEGRLLNSIRKRDEANGEIDTEWTDSPNT